MPCWLDRSPHSIPPDFDIERMRQGPTRLGTAYRIVSGLLDRRPVTIDSIEQAKKYHYLEREQDIGRE